jgi:hypothetical protein
MRESKAFRICAMCSFRADGSPSRVAKTKPECLVRGELAERTEAADEPTSPKPDDVQGLRLLPTVDRRRGVAAEAAAWTLRLRW